MADAPKKRLVTTFRNIGAVDIFCGTIGAAHWLATEKGENLIRQCLTGGHHVRILISDSVARDFKSVRKYARAAILTSQLVWKRFLSKAQKWQGCEVRRSSFESKNSWLVIDRSEAYIESNWLPSLFSTRSREFEPLAASAGPVLEGFFEHIWSPNSSVLYQDLFPTLRERADLRLLQERSKYWSDLIDRLAADPHGLFDLPPRDFEQLVFELLSRDGFECILTPATRDGGYDILARFRTPTSTILYLVECKRFGPQKPVSVSIVRALFGIVEQQSANVGLIVTTSHLSPDARELKDELLYRMEAREYEELVKWLRKHRGRSA